MRDVTMDRRRAFISAHTAARVKMTRQLGMKMANSSLVTKLVIMYVCLILEAMYADQVCWSLVGRGQGMMKGGTLGWRKVRVRGPNSTRPQQQQCLGAKAELVLSLLGKDLCSVPCRCGLVCLLGGYGAGVVEMLLMMSGDVEPNPGPIGVLGPNDLVVVLTELLDICSDWENLGLVLGLSPGFLEALKGPYKPHRDCLKDMLREWLNRSPDPSWQSLIRALRSPIVGKKPLARHLQSKYCTRGGSVPPEDTILMVVSGPTGTLKTTPYPGDETTPRPAAVTADQTPTMMELVMFEGERQRHNIPKEIRSLYGDFGTLLLEDRTGAVVQAIETQCLNDSLRINREILSRWLQGKGRKPVTWVTLIRVLRDIGMNILAEDIEDKICSKATPTGDLYPLGWQATHPPGGQAAPSPDGVLTKAHLPQLMTMLSDSASESFMLGIQLGLNDHLLRTLEYEAGRQSSRFLCSVLSKWLQRSNPPPTLDKLVAAISSPAINNEDLAWRLQHQLKRT